MYNNFTYPLKRDYHNERLIAKVEQEAIKLYDEPIQALSYNKFELYNSTGSRVEYEQEYMRHRKMLCAFSIMALLDEDEKWLLKLYDLLWAICDEFTWALPAHLHGTTNAEQIIKWIDLFASETAFSLSEIYHILGDILPACLKSRIEYELKRRIVEPYLESDYRWGPSNWSGVCVSGVCAAMIYLGLDEEFHQAKEKIMLNLSDFLDSFSEDGCCLEGTLYWGYGFSHFCATAELLRQYTDGKIDYFKNEKVERIAHFGQNMYLDENYIVSFSDSPHQDKFYYGLFSLLRTKYPDITIPGLQYESVFGDDVRYRFMNLVRNLYWTNPDLKEETNKNVVIYKDAGWYINKKNNYAFAAKAGHNAEPHNHNDIGSFLVVDDGKYIIDDPGWPQYDGSYFTDKRYEYMCASSLGHPVPVISDNAQLPGEECQGKIISADEKTFEIEFSKAYGVDNLKELARKFTLSENQLLIEDNFSGENLTVTERFISQIKPEISDNKVIIGNFTLECSNDAKIKLSDFSFIPRFAGLDGKEDETDIRYIIDFELKESQQVKFTLKKHLN